MHKQDKVGFKVSQRNNIFKSLNLLNSFCYSICKQPKINPTILFAIFNV